MKNIARSAAKYINDIKKNDLIIAEIGVQDGLHAINMLENLNIDKLYLIDNFPTYIDGNITIDEKTQFLHYKNMFINLKPYYNKIIFVHQPSDLASTLFEDNYFDFIYIDANHTYEFVKNDINLWWKKIKINGYISGHDYFNSWQGVISAVNEFVEKNKLDLITFNKDSDWIIEKKYHIIDV